MSQRAKILIVDDEPFNVDYLEQELEDFGYDTMSAANGREALDKVATEHPDLILLDVMMPLMDSFTVCRILKENDDTLWSANIVSPCLQLPRVHPHDRMSHPALDIRRRSRDNKSEEP